MVMYVNDLGMSVVLTTLKINRGRKTLAINLIASLHH